MAYSRSRIGLGHWYHWQYPSGLTLVSGNWEDYIMLVFFLPSYILISVEGKAAFLTPPLEVPQDITLSFLLTSTLNHWVRSFIGLGSGIISMVIIPNYNISFNLKSANWGCQSSVLSRISRKTLKLNPKRTKWLSLMEPSEEFSPLLLNGFPFSHSEVVGNLGVFF